MGALGAELVELAGADGWPTVGAGGIGAAVIAVATPAPPARWLFEAGLAIGALGARAIVVELGSAALPPELRGLDTLRLDAEDPATPALLADRLRFAAGWRAGPA